jgi:hypothetical protein
VKRPETRHFLLALILLLALAVRLYQLTKASLWLDEILTVQLSTGGGYAHLDFPQDRLIPPPADLIGLDRAPRFWRIWTSLDRDVHPPLYYLVLRGWRELFGDGDVAIRMLPVMLSLLAIVMLYFAAEPQFGAPPALWACALMTLAGPQIEYAQENRSYMLLLVALLSAAAALVRIEKLGPTMPRQAAVFLATLAALLTHYAAIPVIGLFLVYAVARRRWRAAAAVAAAGAVFLLAWGPFWLEQLRGFAQRIEFTQADDQSILRTLRGAAELPLRYFTEAAVRPRGVGVLAAVLYVLPALLIVVRRRWALLVWWLWLIGYALFIAGSDLLRGGRTLELTRYTLPASPAAYVLVAALLADARSRWVRHGVPALLVVACLAALPAAYARSKADWRGLGRFFASRVAGDDVIVVSSSDRNDWRARCMYLCLRHYAPRPPLPVVFVSKPDPSVLAQIARRNVWLLSGAYVVQDEPLLPGWRQVEMRGDPMAGTVALMEPDQRGMGVSPMRNRGATLQQDAAGRRRAHGRDAHATLQPRAEALSPGGRAGSTITACP